MHQTPRNLTVVRTVALATLATLATECPSVGNRQLNDPQEIVAEGPYRHAPSGVTFPTSVGHFRRAQMTRFDQGGRDVGVGYNCEDSNHPVLATTFIYPMPKVTSVASPAGAKAAMLEGLTDQLYESAKKDVVLRGGRLVAEGHAPVELHHPSERPGSLAVFELDSVEQRGTVPLRSYLFFYPDVPKGWIFKVRVTHPRALDGEDEVTSFVRSFHSAAIAGTRPSNPGQ